MNPRNLNHFAVGGSDQYACVYDIWRLKTDGSRMKDNPAECHALKHLQGSGHEESITCVAYSHQGELLASYNDELIYLFDKSMSLGSNLRRMAEANDSKEEGNEHEDGNNDEEGKTSQPSHQEAPKLQVYEGHHHHNTAKGVNFFGPNLEYVVSGSDCGRIFIWKKKDGELVAMMKVDHSVVNCLEPHPHATFLATSGDDDTIKVWAPLSDRRLDLPLDADRDKVMKMNKRRREYNKSPDNWQVPIDDDKESSECIIS